MACYLNPALEYCSGVWAPCASAACVQSMYRTCCLFSFSSFMRMPRQRSVSWKVCLSAFSIRTLWNAPTAIPHINTTAFDISWEGSEREREGQPESQTSTHNTTKFYEHTVCYPKDNRAVTETGFGYCLDCFLSLYSETQDKLKNYWNKTSWLDAGRYVPL